MRGFCVVGPQFLGSGASPGREHYPGARAHLGLRPRTLRRLAALHQGHCSRCTDDANGACGSVLRAAQSPAVEIDHVFPLSAAWDMGAWGWDNKRKAEFANDPLNLVATDKALNQAKSDSLPSEWLPPANRCDYARRLAAVARKYELALPAADVRTMRRQCRFDFRLPNG